MPVAHGRNGKLEAIAEYEEMPLPTKRRINATAGGGPSVRDRHAGNPWEPKTTNPIRRDWIAPIPMAPHSIFFVRPEIRPYPDRRNAWARSLAYPLRVRMFPPGPPRREIECRDMGLRLNCPTATKGLLLRRRPRCGSPCGHGDYGAAPGGTSPTPPTAVRPF